MKRKREKDIASNASDNENEDFLRVAKTSFLLEQEKKEENKDSEMVRAYGADMLQRQSDHEGGDVTLSEDGAETLKRSITMISKYIISAVTAPLSNETAANRKIVKPRHVYTGILNSSSLQSCINLHSSVNQNIHLDSNSVTASILKENIEKLKGKVICIEGNYKSGKFCLASQLSSYLSTNCQINCQILSPSYTSETSNELYSNSDEMNDIVFVEHVHRLTEAITRIQTTFEMIRSQKNEKIFLVTYSPFTVFCLSKVAFKSGLLSAPQFNFLVNMYKIYITEVNAFSSDSVNPLLYIYLDTHFEVCYNSSKPKFPKPYIYEAECCLVRSLPNLVQHHSPLLILKTTPLVNNNEAASFTFNVENVIMQLANSVLLGNLVQIKSDFDVSLLPPCDYKTVFVYSSISTEEPFDGLGDDEEIEIKGKKLEGGGEELNGSYEGQGVDMGIEGGEEIITKEEKKDDKVEKDNQEEKEEKLKIEIEKLSPPSSSSKIKEVKVFFEASLFECKEVFINVVLLFHLQNHHQIIIYTPRKGSVNKIKIEEEEQDD